MKVEDGEATLMILREEKAMYPFSTYALTVSQSSKRQLAKYLGAVIVFKDGSVKEIEEIERLGYYGSKLSEKISSALFGVYRIKTTLRNSAVSLADLRSMIAEYLTLDIELSLIHI